jgi:hypothetical protein
MAITDLKCTDQSISSLNRVRPLAITGKQTEFEFEYRIDGGGDLLTKTVNLTVADLRGNPGTESVIKEKLIS